MSGKRKASALDAALAKFQKVQASAAQIQIDVAKTRDKPSTAAKADRLKAMAEAEAAERRERERAAQANAPREPPRHIPNNILMKQKRVLDLLNTTRNNFTVAELHNELGFSCSDPVLWDMLIQNPKIQQGMHERRTRMEPTVSYKPKHVFEGKREMLELVTKMPDGVLMDDVADAYTGALEDCEALIEEGLVLMLTNAENRERVLYPIDEKYECDVDDDMATLFHAVDIPAHDPDFDTALRKVGHEPAPRRATRPTGLDSDDEGGGKRKAKAKKKRKVNFARMKVTNKHLLDTDLFKKDAPDRLDGNGASRHAR